MGAFSDTHVITKKPQCLYNNKSLSTTCNTSSTLKINNYSCNNKYFKNKYKENDLIQPEIRKYTFIKGLGEGGFGKVSLYRENNNPKNLIAVKEFSGFNEDNFPKYIKKEKKLLSEIRHKYIIKYIFSCFDNNNFYIGMEFCENGALEYLINKKIAKKEKVDEDFIWKVAYQALRALEYLHIVKKVVHNDIKPLNLLLTKNNDIKLTDFGISGIIPIYSNIRSTMKVIDKSGTIIFSTPPEFIKDGQTTFKSDIWALGCSLYYLANLELPFIGNNEQIKMQILQNEPSRLDNIYSNELDSFIFKMITKDPIKRPSAIECLKLIPPNIMFSFEHLFIDRPMSSISVDFSQLFYDIDIPNIPLDIKETFVECYNIIYEFPKFSIRDFLCSECENENRKVFPFIHIDFMKAEINCFCQNEHYFSGDWIQFYRNYTSSKFYRDEINEIYCTDCKKENDFYPKENYKFCNICKKVLCPKCERIHMNSFPYHELKEKYYNENCSCMKHYKYFEYFCNDCMLNLCEDCSVEHEESNYNHDIIEIKNQIDDEIIKEIQLDIEKIKKSIIFHENLIKTKQCNINKFYFLNVLNIVKVTLLYKITFLEMYKKNKNNYIIIKNLLDNKMIIPNIEMFIELDELDEKKR